MIKNIVNSITGQSFQCNDTQLFVITVTVLFIIRNVLVLIDWLGQSLILELHWSYGI